MAGKLTEEQKASRKIKTEETKRLQEEAAVKSRAERQLEMSLEKCQQEVEGTKSKYSYTVGETVAPRQANWKSLEILEILDEGRIFKVKIMFHDEKKQSINPKIDYVSHLQIVPENLELAPSMAKRSLSRMIFSNNEIGSLIHMHYFFGIDYDPEYQRGLVWNQDDNEKLIDSIMNEIDIGKFAFIENEYDSSKPNGGKLYTLVDGKQRLSAIISYYEDKFTYKGIFYSQLSNTDKRHFTSHLVAVGKSQEQLSLIDQYNYFIKLNQSGQPQSSEFMAEVEKKFAKLKKEQK